MSRAMNIARGLVVALGVLPALAQASSKPAAPKAAVKPADPAPARKPAAENLSKWTCAKFNERGPKENPWNPGRLAAHYAIGVLDGFRASGIKIGNAEASQDTWIQAKARIETYCKGNGGRRLIDAVKTIYDVKI